MKICLVTPFFPLDEEDYQGAFCLDFARILIDRGHQVHVHTPGRAGTQADLGVNIHRFPWPGRQVVPAGSRFWHPGDLWDLYRLVRAGSSSLLELVRRERFDTCLALRAIPSGVFAARVCREAKIPFSVWVLGTDVWRYGRNPFFRKTIKNVFKQAALSFADGFNLAKNVEKFAGVDCVFLPSSRVLPAAGEGGRDAAGIGTRFLFVGRFERAKGIEQLIEAALILLRKRKDFSLRIFGEGPLKERLSSRIDASGLAGTVHIEGPLGRRAFAGELAQADAVIIPSLMESIPIVMTDALQKEVPVLVSNVGDMGYLVRVYGAGLVFEPGVPDSLAAAMDQFIADRREFSSRIPELIKEINIKKAADVYLKSISGRKQPGQLDAAG